MPIYKYTARNEYGEKVAGKVEAKDRNQAASTLMSRNLLLIDLKSMSAASFSGLQAKLFGVSQDDIVNFTRQLATMINAGLPLATALAILQDQTKPAMQTLVTKILKDIESGQTFAEALAEHPKVFSRVYIQLVRAGELGGVLDQVLDRLAETLEKQKDFREKTKGAMIYPVIVLIAMVVVAFIMMVFVMPKMTQMYQDFDAELPLPTRLLIALSDFSANYWWALLLMGGGGGFALRVWSQTEMGERKIDQWLMKIPLIGILRKKLILTEFARTLSLLLGSGVSLLEALDIVGRAVDSIAFREVFLGAKEEVEKGVSLSQALEVYEVVPRILPQMVAVGEETGRIDEILLKLAEYYERESEYAVKNLTTAMEPIIMAILGVGVGVMIVAIIMPIYNLTNQF